MTGGIVEMTRGLVGMTRRMVEMTKWRGALSPVISREHQRPRNLHDTGLLRFLPSVEMTGGGAESRTPLKSGADERI